MNGAWETMSVITNSCLLLTLLGVCWSGNAILFTSDMYSVTFIQVFLLCFIFVIETDKRSGANIQHIMIFSICNNGK